jgi:hypothetical protein
MLQSKFYLPKLAASSLFLGSLLALGSTMTAAQVAQAKPTQGTVTTVDAQNRRNLGNSATIGTLEVAPEVKSELEAAPTVATTTPTIELPNSNEDIMQRALRNLGGNRPSVGEPSIGDIRINRGFGFIRTDL